MNMATSAKIYRDNSELQYQIGLEAIGLLKAQNIKKILDLGCGDGRITIQIGKKLSKAQVIGADISDDMLEMAKKAASSRAVKNITFILQDAMRMEYKNQFDAIFSNCMLNFISNHELFYQLLHDAIKPGGQLVVTGFHKVATGKIIEMDIEAIPKILGRDEFLELAPMFKFSASMYSSPEKTRWSLEKAGFTSIEIQTKDIMRQFPSLDAWYAAIQYLRLEYNLKAFPDEKKQEFIEEEKTYLTEQLANFDDAQRQDVLEMIYPAVIINAIKS